MPISLLGLLCAYLCLGCQAPDSSPCMLRGQAIRRPFHYAIIDEADSVLIDDCRNPLVISSAPDDVSKERFVIAHQVRALLPQCMQP